MDASPYDIRLARVDDLDLIKASIRRTLNNPEGRSQRKKFADAVDKAVTEGSNQIDNLSFDISKKDELLNEARKEALADARAKAELYAEAAGVKLGRLRELSEQAGHFPPPRPMMMRMEAKAASADVPVERGEQEVTVNVTATWEIAP